MTNVETTAVHTRLLKCALEIDAARAYWQRADPDRSASPAAAFSDYWFGAKSQDRVKVLLSNFRSRFDAFPSARRVLHQWQDMRPDTRALVCHWHLQLSDPLYREFTGRFLVDRRETTPTVTRDVVLRWVGEVAPKKWTMATRIQFASKLLSSAHSAGLVTKNRDPRPLRYPRVGDDALTYVLYLLREVEYEGTLLDNPYLRSVGLTERDLEDRVRRLPALTFRRQADLVDFGWRHPSLASWAGADGKPAAAGGGA